ncbi:glycosyl hydrolase [Pelagicoccus mobilis]|uniref:Beta-mannosidase-like galactose-binding domain-containing protein n=1 Tax=Pelagicoccus mobilis TaxID=415221 RepID=A0A934S651_9BACT|nr:glycosyl hydrolase [Pelagicoccus mobilis]MBK1879648.1 hypothetical protein [Pelagicoccus mobilis]
MKKWIVGLMIAAATAAHAQNLEQLFRSPPDSARPYTWWHWVNGNVSKEGITKDLEAMKAVGIGGFVLFDASVGIPVGPVAYNSKEEHQLRSFAVAEAERLGLDAGFNNASGWSSTGGPWVPPEHSMKMVVWSEATIRAGDAESVTLGIGKRVGDKRPHMKDVDFYRDIAVMAFPTPTNDDYRIERWEQKGLHDHHAKGIHFIPDLRKAPADAIISADSIINLTDRMNAEGNLDWAPENGEWTVLRFGYMSTGAQNKPATEGGTGLEIDKLSREAVDLHWEEYINKLIANAQGREALTTICIDSFEVGMQNWTEALPREFSQRRGYDFLPWLLCITGRVVDDTETTERVLWDMRVTVAELMQENYFGYFEEKCHEQGFKLQLEPYGSGAFDATATALIGDTVLTEFWQREADRNLWTWTAQIIPSGAHLSGNPIVGAEAFTSLKADWTAHPGRIKKWGDRAFARGINRYYFHTFAHQPFDDSVQPGMTFGPYGGNFHRNNTWFSKSRDWMDYIARCQFLMQSGSYQADVLALYGDGRGFNSFIAGNEPVDMKDIPGFNFDLGGMASLNDLSVDDQGVIRVTHKGKRLDTGYQVLLLKRAELMLPERVAKLGELAEQGAKIFAPRPLRSPSYRNHEAQDAKLAALVEKYWDSGLIQSPDAFEAAVAKLTKDCEVPEKVFFNHHRVGEDDFYFLSNQTDRPREVAASFRIKGKLPELWNPVTGKTQPASSWKALEDGRTEVRLQMPASGSIFVAFRSPTQATGETAPLPKPKEVMQLNEDWTATFDSNWGPEGAVEFKTLLPWNEHAYQEIKYYSGSAIYRRSFTLPRVPKSDSLMLDLGEVGVMARVKLNGRDLGLLWCSPYQVDISKAVKPGKNVLEIEVTNLWINRFIGDEYLASYENIYPQIRDGQPFPADSQRKTFEFRFGGGNAKHWKQTDALHPSGLIGPVRLLKVK